MSSALRKRLFLLSLSISKVLSLINLRLEDFIMKKKPLLNAISQAFKQSTGGSSDSIVNKNHN